MAIWNWYSHLMDNNFVLIIGVIVSVVMINWWSEQEEIWKSENKYGTTKKIIKGIGIVLIVMFGLPGIILFFGSI